MRPPRVRAILRVFTTVLLFLTFLCGITLSMILFVYPGIAVRQQVVVPLKPSPTVTMHTASTGTPTVTAVPTTLTTGSTASTDSSIISVVVGGIIGIVGAAVGSVISYWLENKREERRKRMDDLREAVEWARKGREKSFRRADLSNADLRGVDLKGADLAFANLRKADLTQADLREADLRGADLRDVIGHEAKLARANMEFAKAWGASFDSQEIWDAAHRPFTERRIGNLQRLWYQAIEAPLLMYFRLWERLLPNEMRIEDRLDQFVSREIDDRESAYRKREIQIRRDPEASDLLPWAFAMLLANVLILAMAVSLIALQRLWLMALILTASIPLLNLLLLIGIYRCQKDSSIIRSLLVVNTAFTSPVIVWIIWSGEWLLALVVIASVFALSIPLLAAQLARIDAVVHGYPLIPETLQEFVASPYHPPLQVRQISTPDLLLLAITPIGIDLAVGLALLTGRGEIAVAIIGVLFIMGMVFLSALHITEFLSPLLRRD